MNILITGSGGREHGLAWRAARSPLVEIVYVAPGNAGTASEAKVRNIDIDVMDFDAQIKFARDNDITLTIIGPEAPLVAGVVDEFKRAGLTCFGPGKTAAQLEGSKTFTKDFLHRHNIPTARYGSFEDEVMAIEFARNMSVPMVVKADGLAAGKGVVIAYSVDDAERTIRDMMSGARFGKAGGRVVVEEFLEGEEASFIVVADGHHFIPFATSQDHKAAYDGDKGPNTGGMGAYSPAPVVTDAVHDRVVSEIIEPTIRGMESDGMPYTGFLYAGLMIDQHGAPKVIEFNCRFGDPETQPIMLRMESDLVELCLAATNGSLDGREIKFSDQVALAVVLASGGYPGHYESGSVISGLEDVGDAEGKVFHAGTKLDGGAVRTSGGRVLAVTALGSSTRSAQSRAYELVRRISFEGMEYRTDIGYRAVARESA